MSKQTRQLQSLHRDEYLARHWAPYPDAVGLKQKGRVVAIQKQQVVIAQSVPLGKRVKISFTTISKETDWRRILVPGDIVGFEKNGSCVLLAPYL